MNSSQTTSFYFVPIAAFFGSLLAVSLVFGIVPNRRGELPAPVMILAGVTVNFFFAALVMFIHYLSDISQSFQIGNGPAICFFFLSQFATLGGGFF